MRVIAGAAGGRRLKTLPGLQTRPTSDKVKGAIFNVLGSKIFDATVLDLFAGSGALAMEALSRGAKFAFLVEKSAQACTIIRENSRTLGFEHNISLQNRDALQALPDLQQQQFDVVFLDPPYRQGLALRSLEVLSSGNYLTPDAVIIVETSREEQIPVEIGKLSLRKNARYGDTLLWYYQPIETGGKEN